MTFEDPTQLFKCTRVDCPHDRAGGTPFCARHLREQEMSSPGYCEPELEARLAMTVRTEDDDHPGEKKIYDRHTGEASWVPDKGWKPPPPRLLVGPDSDTMDMERANKMIGEIYEPERQRQMQESPVFPLEGPPRDSGVWVAYHSDWSGFAIFDNEMEALRHAVANTMSVGLAKFGEDLGGGRYPSG